MTTFQFGNPNLFLQGVAEILITDPTSGNILGYDNVASESAVNTSVEMNGIRGGIGNPLAMNIPHTTGITGSLTSQAFSLEARALATGGDISFGASAPVCEPITAVAETLTVTQQPVKAYGQAASDVNGWCYVREHGQTEYLGTNYGVNLTTKEVIGFVAEVGKTYDVFYSVSMASAKVLTIPEAFNPTVATVRIKYGVYAKQNNSVTNGTLQGYLYLIVPRAQFNGDAGIGANQTANATSAYDWVAITGDSAVMQCDDCSQSGADYAYYVFVPCAGATASVEALAVIGGGVSIAQGATKQIPVVYVMPDNSILTPTYSDLTYTSSDASVTVDENGIASGVSEGNAVVTIALKSNTAITTTANITVTA